MYCGWGRNLKKCVENKAFHEKLNPYYYERNTSYAKKIHHHVLFIIY